MDCSMEDTKVILIITTLVCLFPFTYVHTWKIGTANVADDVFKGLKTIYKEKLLPLELASNFHELYDSPALDDAEFEARPLIMLVGQYSTGKTTFIQYLLERDFPGMRIGPEPTTDSFMAIMYGERDEIIPGHSLVVDPKRQFRPLSKFGGPFLNRFQGSLTNSEVLKGISILDSPGILSGEKQRTDRGYDFPGVLEWFAERAHRIILIFDAHKLDISDEFKRSIEVLRGHDEKIHIILNKADMLNQQELMRVYGALMWSLGKVLKTPEVTRVYVGSFWDQARRYDENRKLFEAEESDLFQDLDSLPRNNAIRKVNDMVKRANQVRIHAYTIHELWSNMPYMWGKEKKKNQLIDNLAEVYQRIQREHQISPVDFPDVKIMQEALRNHDFEKFKDFTPELVQNVEQVLAEDIPKLMAPLPSKQNSQKDPSILAGRHDRNSPFEYEGAEAGRDESEWIVSKDMHKYVKAFERLKNNDGLVSGTVLKKELTKTKFPNAVITKIMKLSDVNDDRMFDEDELGLCLYLTDIKMEGHSLPAELPPHLVPPSMRKYWHWEL